jgi:hypothetical protein
MLVNRFSKIFLNQRNAARSCIAGLFIVLACLDPYAPPVQHDLRLLVVDGFLDSRQGLARAKLSRTLPIDKDTPYPAESGASVVVEDDDGVRFTLAEVSAGLYEAERNDLQAGKGYRLLISTSFGDSFESDFVVLKESPILESVTWVPGENGVAIQVDSSDPLGTTRYYQWLYTETWEYDADRESQWVIKNGRSVYRTAEERIHICYSTQQSTKVLIATTEDQSGDVINNFELTYIPAGSKKLCRTYSILVQQRALDEEAFNYWSQIQNTTENLGSLFDPLPSRVAGNLHSTEPAGPTVLGYFSGGGVQEKRIYIRFNELPEHLRFVKRRACVTDTIRSLENYPDGTPLVGEITIAYVMGQTVPGYFCMDCRLEGGKVTKPSFWPF